LINTLFVCLFALYGLVQDNIDIFAIIFNADSNIELQITKSTGAESSHVEDQNARSSGSDSEDVDNQNPTTSGSDSEDDDENEDENQNVTTSAPNTNTNNAEVQNNELSRLHAHLDYAVFRKLQVAEEIDNIKTELQQSPNYIPGPGMSIFNYFCADTEREYNLQVRHDDLKELLDH
jgi:hypothetical protein